MAMLIGSYGASFGALAAVAGAATVASVHSNISLAVAVAGVAPKMQGVCRARDW